MIENKVGTLPCNVIFQELGRTEGEVAAMRVIATPELTRAGREVHTRPGRVIETLGARVQIL